MPLASIWMPVLLPLLGQDDSARPATPAGVWARYEIVNQEIVLGRNDHAPDWPESEAETCRRQLLPFGSFTEITAGESLDLVAIRQGLEPAVLHALNHWNDGGRSTLVCLGSRHRVLPGETLADVATLYSTEAEALRQLNGLAEGVEPEAWTALLVPPHIEGPLDDSNRYRFRGVSPLWSEFTTDPDGLGHRLGFGRHQVEAGETWSSIAERYHTRVAVLRSLNETTPEEEHEEGEAAAPRAGSTLLADLRLRTIEAEDPEARVLFVERYLGVPLEEVLALQGVAGIEPLLEEEEWRIPFSCLFGYPNVRMREHMTMVSGSPGSTSVHLEAGKDGILVRLSSR